VRRKKGGGTGRKISNSQFLNSAFTDFENPLFDSNNDGGKRNEK
jgi:hypothetical protein